VEAILNYYSDGIKVSQPTLREGEVLRVWSDLFITKEESRKFKNSTEVINPSSIYYPFKK
jgi:hypothetical protein